MKRRREGRNAGEGGGVPGEEDGQRSPPNKRRRRIGSWAKPRPRDRLPPCYDEPATSTNISTQTQSTGTQPQSQRRKKKRSNRVRHDVLQSVFPSCQTLHQFLLRLKMEHGDASSKDACFLQATDPAPYRLMLTRAVIAVPATAPPLPQMSSFKPVFTMEDIVVRVIQTLCRESDFTTHLLAKGYRKIKTHQNGNHGIIGMWGVEPYFPNSIVNLLKTPAWQLLLSRIGDVVMTYMLLHTFMFLPLPNNCYMQITGSPLWLSGPNSMMEEGNRQGLWTRKDRYYTLPPYTSTAHRKRRKEIMALIRRSSKVPRHRGARKASKRLRTETPATSRRAMKKRRRDAQSRETDCSLAPTPATSGPNMITETDVHSSKTDETSQSALESAKRRRKKRKRGSKKDVVRCSSPFDQHQAKIRKHKRKARRKREQARKLAKAQREEQLQMLRNDRNVNVEFTGHSGNQLKQKGKKPRLSIWRRRKEKIAERRLKEERTGAVLERKEPVGFVCDSDDPMSEDDGRGAYDQNTTGHIKSVQVTSSEDHRTSETPEERGRKRRWSDIAGRKYRILKHKKRRKVIAAKLAPRRSVKKIRLATKGPTSVNDPYVPRTRIFYANPATGHFGLPPRHILNRVRCTKIGARRLLREIFLDEATHPHDLTTTVSTRLTRTNSKSMLRNSDSTTHKRTKTKNIRLPNSLRTLMPIAMHIIRRHQKTKKTKTYSRALHRYCPIPVLSPPAEEPDTKSESEISNNDMHQTICDELYTQEGQRKGIDTSQMDLAESYVPLCQEQTTSTAENARTTMKPRKTNEALSQLRRITSYATLFSIYCQYRQVAGFVKAVLAYLLPSSLWGSKHNITILGNSIDEFIRLRRFDRYSIYSALCGLRLSDMKWLRSVRRQYWEKQLIIQRLVKWVYSQIIIPIIRIHFYVTESGQHGRRIFYYRKPVWAHIYKLAVNEFKQNQVLTEIQPEQAKQLLIKPSRHLGFSFIRFLPKSGGVRPIVNLKRKPSDHSAISILDYGARSVGSSDTTRLPCYKVTAAYLADKFNKKISQSINKILEDTFRIMNHAKNTNPEVLGASVFSYNDIYIRLSTFLNELRLQRKSNKLPRLYFVSMDIKSCFNNINQHKCYQIVEELLKDDHHLIRRFNTHTPVPTLRHIASRTEGRVMDLSEMKPSAEFAEEVALTRKNSVIVDQVVHVMKERSETLELLHQHLFDNLIVDRMSSVPTFYRQTKGIAQGSVLSSLLCSLVYGDLENTRFKHLPWDCRSLPTFYTPQVGDGRTDTQTTPFTQSTQPTQSFVSTTSAGCTPSGSSKGVLVRLIDDFLYITTSKRMAKRFVLDMHKGYPEHGCTINTQKTQLNFDMNINGVDLQNVCPRTKRNGRPTEPVISWCGLLINTRSLHVKADYTRYIGTYVAEQLTVGGGGRTMWKRILDSLKPKCHALLLDARINPPEVIALNIYQSFMLGAIRFYCQAKAMPCGPNQNPVFFLGVIFDVVKYMWMLVQSRTSCAMAKQMNCQFPLSRQEVMWLGFRSFSTVLKAKRTNFASLLPPLLAKTSQIWRTLRRKRVKQRLAYAADPKNSEVFKYVRY